MELEFLEKYARHIYTPGENASKEKLTEILQFGIDSLPTCDLRQTLLAEFNKNLEIFLKYIEELKKGSLKDIISCLIEKGNSIFKNSLIVRKETVFEISEFSLISSNFIHEFLNSDKRTELFSDLLDIYYKIETILSQKYEYFLEEAKSISIDLEMTKSEILTDFFLLTIVYQSVSEVRTGYLDYFHFLFLNDIGLFITILFSVFTNKVNLVEELLQNKHTLHLIEELILSRYRKITKGLDLSLQ